MRVKGSTRKKLFESAAAGMMELLAPAHPLRSKRVRRRVATAAIDASALLIEFLNAVLLQALTRRERYGRVSIRSLSEREVVADLRGCAVRAFGEDIKAVTHHAARLRRTRGGLWEIDVLFDI
jgi:SHS2 domain-containing protein